MPYDHKNPTKATPDDCEAAVGSRAILMLGGTIVQAGESLDGQPLVMFEADERYGLDETERTFTGDLEMFHVFPEES